MALINKKLTELTEKLSVPDDAFIHIVDTSDTSQSPEGSSYKAKKSTISGTVKAQSGVSGTVKTNSNSVDPIVYLKDEVDTLILGKQDSLGFTSENVANKQNNLDADITNDKYPTVTAVNNGLSVKADTTALALKADKINTYTKAETDNIIASVEIDVTNKENTANKQNNLLVDNTGVKFPTVDAVNNGLDQKKNANIIDNLQAVTDAGNFTTNTIDSGAGLSVASINYNNTFTAPNTPLDVIQGYAFDGNYHYLFGNNVIRKYNLDYSLLLSNTNALAGIAGVDHLGDGFVLSGFIYVPVESYPAVTGMRIAKYNASTLALVTTYDISAQGHECSSMTTDGSTIYISSYDDGTKFYKYDFVGNYLGFITVSSPFTNNVQGISLYNNEFFVVEQTNIWKLSLDGTVKTYIKTAPGNVADTHRGQGLDVVGGEIRVMIMSATSGNVYYLNPQASLTKSFTVGVDGIIKGSGMTLTGGASNDLLVTSQNTNSAGLSGFTARDNIGNKYLTFGINNSVGIAGASYGVAGEGLVRSSSSTSGLNLSVTSGNLKFLTTGAGTERVRLVGSTGNFLIGSATDNTTDKLQVNGTASSGTTVLNNTPPIANNHLTRKDYVDLRAPLASPTLTGVPTAPTATLGTNTTQIATTAFVQANTNSNALLLTGSQTATGRKTFVSDNTTVGGINVVNSKTTTSSFGDNFGMSIFNTGSRGLYIENVNDNGILGLSVDNNSTGTGVRITNYKSGVGLVLLNNSGTGDLLNAEVGVTRIQSTGRLSTTLAPVSGNDVANKTYVDNTIKSKAGWANYSTTTYTSASPFSISPTSTVTLPNNANNSIITDLPLGVTAFYNGTTNKITPVAVGDAYTVNVRFKAKTTTNNDYLTLFIDIGTSDQINAEAKQFLKGANTEQAFSFTLPIYTLSTFVTNGGLIKITSNLGTITVYDITYFITRNYTR